MSDKHVLRILIADDEDGMREGIRRALSGLVISGKEYHGDYRVVVDDAADGQQTRDKLAAGPVDILLLDHSMPGCTGMEILEDLNRDASDILTIMVTAYASLEMAVKATKQGAFDFLAKPFTPVELRKVVQKAARHLLATRAARKLSDEKRRVRFEFLSILSHELKAPLGAVEGYLRLLEEGVTKDDPEGTARVVARCIDRLEGMRKLIFDMLDLTRIESGQKTRELHDVDLAAVVSRVQETFAAEAAERGIEIKLDVQGDTAMQGDPGELEIIFNNLVSNAVKYNRDQGRVTVAVQGDRDMLTADVVDTGIGMTEEETNRLFGEFVRIKNDKTRAIQGSGLGLSIVRRLARLNGGDVTVTSRDNEGSTFRVTLARSGCAADAGKESS
jgi:two-component system, sensor histidine kinase and response regulator